MTTTAAVALDRFGGPEVLELRETEVPEPGPHQVRLAVEVAGVGPTNLDIRAGRLERVFGTPPGTAEPDGVSWEGAAAVTAGGEAAGRVLSQLGVSAGEQAGAEPVPADDLGRVGRVDAVVDAATVSDLRPVVELAGGPERVLTLSNHSAASLGVRLSGPDPGLVDGSVAEAMAALATGGLVLRMQKVLPLRDAAEAHRRLEAGERAKVLLRV